MTVTKWRINGPFSGGFPPRNVVVLLWICLIWSLSRVNLDKHFVGSSRVVFFRSDVWNRQCLTSSWRTCFNRRCLVKRLRISLSLQIPSERIPKGQAIAHVVWPSPRETLRNMLANKASLRRLTLTWVFLTQDVLMTRLLHNMMTGVLERAQVFRMELGNQEASPSAAGELPSCLASVDTLVLTSDLKVIGKKWWFLTFTLGSCRSQKRQKINKSYTCHHYLKNSFQQDVCPLSNLHHTSSDKAANLVSSHSLTPTC